MANYLGDDVGIVHNFEIEAPVLVDIGLPAVFRFILLFGAQGRMMEVAGEKPKVLVKGAKHGQKDILQRLNDPIGEDNLHEAFRLLLRARISSCKNLMASPAVLKGP